MSNPWTEAWEEAEATAPPQEDVYTTIELQHASFVGGSPAEPFAVRIVNGVNEVVSFGIEDDAFLNAGETVPFDPVPFWAEHPEFAEGKTPEVPVVIDNIADDVLEALLNASEFRADLTMIYREYLKSDMSAPSYGPVEFKVRNVSITGSTVKGTARIDDLANMKFPKAVYTVNEFPALLG